nr:MAG TPA: hypothetical protein [Caudoviricetes sp.]
MIQKLQFCIMAVTDHRLKRHCSTNFNLRFSLT